MERTITQTGALYLAQHKEAAVQTRTDTSAPRIWHLKIKRVGPRTARTLLPGIRLLYRDNGR